MRVLHVIYPWSVRDQLEDTLYGEAERERHVHIAENVHQEKWSAVVLVSKCNTYLLIANNNQPICNPNLTVDLYCVEYELDKSCAED